MNNKLIGIVQCLCAFSLTFPLYRYLPNVFSFAILFGLILLANEVIRRKVKISFTTPVFLFFIFLLYLIINILITGMSDRGLQDLAKYGLAFIILFFLTHSLKNYKQLKNISYTWIIGIVLSTLLGIYEGVSGITLQKKVQQYEYFNEGLIRYIPYDLEPNYLQICLPFALLISLFFFKREQGNKRIFLFVAFVIVILEYFLTVSKFALITLLLLLPFLLYDTIKSGKLRKYSLLTLGFLITLLIWLNIDLSFFEYNIERYSTLGSSNINEVTSSRSFLVDEAFQLFAQSPLYGAGLGETTNYLTAKYGGGAGTTHNTYIHILSETGIIGFILFLMILASCIRIQKFSALNIYQKISLITLLPMLSITAGTSTAFWFVMAVGYKSKDLINEIE